MFLFIQHSSLSFPWSLYLKWPSFMVISWNLWSPRILYPWNKELWSTTISPAHSLILTASTFQPYQDFLDPSTFLPAWLPISLFILQFIINCFNLSDQYFHQKLSPRQLWIHPSVTKLKELTASGILFKNEAWLSLGSFIYLQQVKETGHSHPKLCLPRGLAIAYMHYLVNYMLISSPQTD